MPGVTDTGNHCDDCLTSITLPFAVSLYDQSFTSVFAGSNGALFFGSGDASFAVTCSPFGLMGTSYVLAPYWADQCTTGCGSTACTNCGIFTTTTGTAPNRVFYIEFLTNYFNQAIPLDYEVALFENHTPSFEFIYNTINPAAVANDSQLVIGVKQNDTTFTQYACDPTGGQNPPVSSGQAVIASCVGGVTPTPTPTPTPAPTLTPTPTPTGTPTGCQSRVLIVNADCGVLATMLTNELLADGATLVDNFDAVNGTPTLAQLQQYDIVVPFSNCGYNDAVTLGNNLDAYEAGGGVVVAFTFDWNGAPFSIGGAWITNDSPFNDNAPTNFTNGTLGTCTVTELCNGVTTLNAFFRESPTLASGATQAATWNDGGILMAYKGNAVAVSAYVGDSADNWSGDFARVILNAGSFLHTCQGATPTPTPTCIPGGLLVGSGMTLGFAPNGWNPTLATDTVNYTFSNSQTAPNQFALFDTHDPWGFTILKDAITGNGHTYTEFTPAQLAGFDFSQYSVVVLNWDDTLATDFLAQYSAAVPALEAYINAGGVVWVQAAMQGCGDVLAHALWRPGRRLRLQ